jgi:beta-phosphoglucomutase-like phosphatase (HAD superfamily)
MPLPSAIIFDFDGTLVTGTNAGYVRCYHSAILSQGYELPFDVTEERVLEKWGTAPRIELQNVLRDVPHLVEGALVEYEKLLTIF